MISQLMVSMVIASSGVVGTMVLLLRHFQESARRRESEINRRIEAVHDETRHMAGLYDALKDEVRREYVRDHQLKELRDEMRAGFATSGEKIAAMSAALERLIGRLERRATT